MVAFPVFTVTDLSAWSGRPESSYASYANSALAQSTLLLKLATCLTSWPTTQDQADLAKYAILSMADTLTLEQPYQGLLASPFQSENIGSYGYSKSSTASAGVRRSTYEPPPLHSAIMSGQVTGIYWFDLAVSELSVCDAFSGLSATGVTGGATSVFENDMLFFKDSNGNKHMISPKDIDPLDIPGADDFIVFDEPGF